jgi:hypothetical protein
MKTLGAEIDAKISTLERLEQGPAPTISTSEVSLGDIVEAESGKVGDKN